MKYSSHLYLRIDGTLGRFPIIDVNAEGLIVEIIENEIGLTEIEGLRFYSGVIVPKFQIEKPFAFSSVADFCKKINLATKNKIKIGSYADFMLITGFDLNTFVSEQPIIKYIL